MSIELRGLLRLAVRESVSDLTRPRAWGADRAAFRAREGRTFLRPHGYRKYTASWPAPVPTADRHFERTGGDLLKRLLFRTQLP